jgi:AraC-like DNA-binding protein
MKKIDARMAEEFFIGNVTTMSGVRPRGRGTECRGGRENHGLLYIRSGSACFWCDGRDPITVETGGVAYLPKHRKYKMQYVGEYTDFALVNFELFSVDGEELSLADDITLLSTNGLEASIDWIMHELDAQAVSNGFLTRLRRKELMYRLLRVLYSETPTLVSGVSAYPQILAGTRLLEERYLENLPISRFAEASKISISSFRSLFAKQYGMSPVHYRNRLRLERARRLLEEGTYTVSEVAYACGFENVGYFCRYYKRELGEAPGEAKKRNRD